MSKNYARTIEELNARAVFWWPKSLSDLETNASIIPMLLKTQDQFLSILNLCVDCPFQVYDLIGASKFPANLFLKHLVVLADFGGEQIQRLNSQFDSIFPKDNFTFSWNGKNHKYEFKKLPVTSILNNNRLSINGKDLLKEKALDELMEDLIAILLYGSSALNDSTAESLRKCDIGVLLGRKAELEKYVKEKYIWVSRITGGAQANTLGQVAQTYVANYLRKKLGKKYSVSRNGIIPVKGHTPIPFDVVVQKDNNFLGVELTFQVTTNSTIERKAGQAQDRQKLLHKSGYHIGYIIDGAGNFQRKSAISTICKYSDCTVAFSDNEFSILIDFIKEKLR